MNEQSTFGTIEKSILAILFGLLGLFLSPHGIMFILATVKIDIPWSLIFPILIATTFGWRYGLLAGLSGGALFPFLLWAEDGWVNVTTSFTYVLFYTLLGVASNFHYFKKLETRLFRIAIAVAIHLIINLFYDAFCFLKILNFNPAFWNEHSIRYIDQSIVYGFWVKDSVNIVALVLCSETLLRLPIIRKVFGLPSEPTMQANHWIFVFTFITPILIWLSFIGLGEVLLREHNALQYEHKSFALLVILTNGFLVSLILFHFSEKHFTVQEELNKSEKKFRSAFENVQDVFYQTDLKGTVQEISPSIKQLTEYETREILGTPLYQLCINAEHGKEWIDLVIKNGEMRNHETTIKTKTGKLKHVSVNSRVIVDEAGKPNHIDGLIRDVSENKKQALEIEVQNNKLKTQNRELEQFAYIASHDLQEPLLTLTSVSKLFKEEFAGQLNQEGNQYLGFISSLTQRMHHLVKGLLDYSRIGKEGMLQVVNTQQLLAEVLADMAFSIEQSHAKVTVDSLPELKAYMPELKQVFQNLISNAIKFRKEATIPKILISAKREDKHWVFSISDNGIGIEEDDKEKIFIIFKRLHNRKEYEGTGIGLAHCHKIINLHGGEIWVDSKLGQGSTFYFSIPQL